MDNTFVLISIICLSLFGIVGYTHANLEYKNGERNTSCTGQCYVDYVAQFGTPAEIEQRKRELASSDEFSSIRSLWAGCAACHGQDGGGMGPFPALAGKTSDYIAQRLVQYKNKEQVGAMSATMWAQAGMLSDSDIETIGKFIEAGLPK